MIILGVDPGLRTTGYGVISTSGRDLRLLEAGIIRPKQRLPLEARLHELYTGLCEVIVATNPCAMAIEEIWVGERDPQAALIMGHARGVLCLAAGVHGIALQHLAHTTVKRALTGSGGSDKAQVKRMVVQLLQLRQMPEPDDVSDALAVAIAHANMQRSERLTQALTKVS